MTFNDSNWPQFVSPGPKEQSRIFWCRCKTGIVVVPGVGIGRNDKNTHLPPGGIVDIRSRRDFSRFDRRPERPHFSNFGPPAVGRPFCKKVFGHGEKAWFSGLVDHEGRWATLAGLVPICPCALGHVLVDLTPI